MKKYATKFEKLFQKKLIGEGLDVVDMNCCELKNNNITIRLSFFMYYNSKSMEFNSGGSVIVYSKNADLLLKNYNGKDIFSFYYKNNFFKTFLIDAPMIWYLQFHHGKENYPGNMYKYFDKSIIINNVEEAVEYFYKELYQKVFIPIKECYGTIALADKNINDEILKTGEVKEANIVWADHDFHCMRSLLFAYMNENPNLPQLIEICNAEMEKTRKAKPESERLKIYEFIVEKVTREL